MHGPKAPSNSNPALSHVGTKLKGGAVARQTKTEVVHANPSFTTPRREANPLIHHGLVPVDTDDLVRLIRVLVRRSAELGVHGVNTVDPSVGRGRGVQEVAGEDF